MVTQPQHNENNNPERLEDTIDTTALIALIKKELADDWDKALKPLRMFFNSPSVSTTANKDMEFSMKNRAI